MSNCEENIQIGRSKSIVQGWESLIHGIFKQAQGEYVFQAYSN